MEGLTVYLSASKFNKNLDIKSLTVSLSVWGFDYTEFFILYSLPSLFSPKNLPYVSKHRKIFFDIFTTANDKIKIQNAINGNIIYNCVEFTFYLIEGCENSNKYAQMNLHHAESLRQSKFRKSLISYLSPDAILADGGFETIEKAIEEGFLAVCCMAPCANKKSAQDDLRKHLKEKGFSINPRKLAKIWFNHKNTLASSHFVDRKLNLLVSPSYFYFSINRFSLISRQFHLHPIMVDPENSPNKICGTFDLFFVEDSIKNFSRVKIITDSDDLNYVEFSDNYKTAGGLNEKDLQRIMPKFLIESTKVFNLKNVWININYHASSKTNCEKTKKRADGFIQNLLSNALVAKKTEFLSQMGSREILYLLFQYTKKKIPYWININSIEYKRLSIHIFRIAKNIHFFSSSFLKMLVPLSYKRDFFDGVVELQKSGKNVKTKPDIIYDNKKTLVLYRNTADLMEFLEKNKKALKKYSSKVKFEKI